METKVALISANRHKEPYPVYPLGTAYLKSYVEQHIADCVVDVVDMNLLSLSELQQYLTEQSPDFICISIRNVDGANSLDKRGFLPDYKLIVNTVRQSTSRPIIVGGAGFSIFPEVFIRELGADYGIAGEGEAALSELILALSAGQQIAKTPHLIPRDGVKYIKSPQAVYEPQLVEYYWKESGMLNIQTKRGCPYNCIYCTYPQIDGRCVRTMDVGSIVETIAKMKRDYGVNYWFFTDSIFNINDRYNAELAEALVKSGVNISWGAYFAPKDISDEQMALYKASGLTHIEYGTESFCDATLEAYGKRFTFDDVLSCSEMALKHNVFYSHFLILGGWGESRQQLETTIRNSKKLRHTVIFPYIGMRIYPNTRLHKYAIEDGVVDVTDDLMEPRYYITRDFDLELTKQQAKGTSKAWIFPDAPQDEMVNILKFKRNKKGPLWEYLRKP
ncbi:MAG: lipid biosynthesis B12-binding/radical SAM protein [Mucinivorans sp.]